MGTLTVSSPEAGTPHSGSGSVSWLVPIHLCLTPQSSLHAQLSSGLPTLGPAKQEPELRTWQLRGLAKGQPLYRDSCSPYLLPLSSQKFFALDLLGDPREVSIFVFPLYALRLNTFKLQLTMEQRIILINYKLLSACVFQRPRGPGQNNTARKTTGRAVCHSTGWLMSTSAFWAQVFPSHLHFLLTVWPCRRRLD